MTIAFCLHLLPYILSRVGTDSPFAFLSSVFWVRNHFRNRDSLFVMENAPLDEISTGLHN